MKNKRIFDHNILKMNKNESLLININEINATLKILKNDKKQYFVIKRKLQISKNKINDTIKEHHDESLYEHFDVNKTLQIFTTQLRVLQHETTRRNIHQEVS